MTYSEWKTKNNHLCADTEKAWNDALAEVEKMLQERLEKKKTILQTADIGTTFRVSGETSECESILSAIQKLKEGGRG